MQFSINYKNNKPSDFNSFILLKSDGFIKNFYTLTSHTITGSRFACMLKA